VPAPVFLHAQIAKAAAYVPGKAAQLHAPRCVDGAVAVFLALLAHPEVEVCVRVWVWVGWRRQGRTGDVDAGKVSGQRLTSKKRLPTATLIGVHK
jgi:hypothetical protein